MAAMGQAESLGQSCLWAGVVVCWVFISVLSGCCWWCGWGQTKLVDVGEGIKKFYEPVADGGDIFVVAHEFKTVEVGDVAFMGDEVPGGAVVGAEVGVAAGDNSANKCPVGGVIKEANDLDGDRARLSPWILTPPPYVGQMRTYGLVTVRGPSVFLMGIRADGKPSL